MVDRDLRLEVARRDEPRAREPSAEVVRVDLVVRLPRLDKVVLRGLGDVRVVGDTAAIVLGRADGEAEVRARQIEPLGVWCGRGRLLCVRIDANGQLGKDGRRLPDAAEMAMMVVSRGKSTAQYVSRKEAAGARLTRLRPACL